MRQCQHTGRPPHGAIGLWFARPARQRTRPPLRHCATIPPRTCVTAPPWCAAHAHCTLSAHPAAVSAALAAAPQARPPNAHSRPQTNATDKLITQAPQPGACPWPGLPHAGLPHAGPPPPPRQWSAPPARTCAWTHGSARAAPSRPRAMRTQPPALHRPVQPFIALYRSGRHLRATARGGRLHVRLVHGIARQLHRWGIVRRINWLGLRVLVFAGVFGCCGHGVYLLPQV